MIFLLIFYSIILVFYYQNSKGVPRIYLDGYFFRLNNKSATTVHWNCDKRHTLNCKAWLTTLPSSPYMGTFRQSEHNHGTEAYSKTEQFTLMTDISKIYANYDKTKFSKKNVKNEWKHSI